MHVNLGASRFVSSPERRLTSVVFQRLGDEAVADKKLIKDIPAGASRERVVAWYEWLTENRKHIPRPSTSMNVQAVLCEPYDNVR